LGIVLQGLVKIRDRASKIASFDFANSTPIERQSTLMRFHPDYLQLVTEAMAIAPASNNKSNDFWTIPEPILS
jgi:hypothetical protein